MLEDSVNSLAHAFTAGMFLRMNSERDPHSRRAGRTWLTDSFSRMSTPELFKNSKILNTNRGYLKWANKYCKLNRNLLKILAGGRLTSWLYPDITNRWVISWLVDIDDDQWIIEAQKFCGRSIAHQWHRFLVNDIDYSSMTHRLFIDYHTANERHFSCFPVPLFFVCDSVIWVRRIFPCIWSSCWRCWDAKF